MRRLVLPLALLVGAVSAGQEQRPMRQLPPPTDIDPQLTEQARQLEQQLNDAILGKDVEALDRLVAPEFTLRVADVPQTSLPRTMWMENVSDSNTNHASNATTRPASSRIILRWSAWSRLRKALRTTRTSAAIFTSSTFGKEAVGIGG